MCQNIRLLALIIDPGKESEWAKGVDMDQLAQIRSETRNNQMTRMASMAMMARMARLNKKLKKRRILL